MLQEKEELRKLLRQREAEVKEKSNRFGLNFTFKSADVCDFTASNVIL